MHIFSFKNKNIDQNPLEYLLIFLGFEAFDVSEIDDLFLNWSKTNVIPPQIIILGSDSVIKPYLSRSKSELDNDLSRLTRNSKIMLASFSNDGTILNDSSQDITTLIHTCIQSIVADEVKSNDIVIPAPPGFYFDKLSGRFSSHFMRAELLLKSTNHIELIALRLLKPFNNWIQDLKQANFSVIKIYIDTMSIWPIAEKIIQMHKQNSTSDSEYVIESFKSYDGLDKWNPQRRPAFVLISASTSGGLSKEVQDKLGIRNVGIWTILALENKDTKIDVDALPLVHGEIYRIPRILEGMPTLNGLRSKFETNVDGVPLGYETINIVGERFISQSAKPKRVRITHLSLPEDIKATLRELADKRIVKVGRGRFDAKSRWTLSFDFEKLFKLCGVTKTQETEDSYFYDWLRNYASPGKTIIIYPSSTGSGAIDVTNAAKQMAENCKEMLSKINRMASDAFILSSDELIKSSQITKDDFKDRSVIVVSPIIGNGFSFKQISAQLRLLQPKGPRLFIALAVLPETRAQFNQLKSDIELVDDDRLYQFKYKFVLPVGRLDIAMNWQEESEILYGLENAILVKQKSLPKFLRERKIRINSLQLFGDEDVFLRSSNEKTLHLSSGFFLWPNSTNLEGDFHQAAVLLTVSTLLQASRVAASKSDATSLSTGLFQHALICPESFTRFNDSAIQAALLRAAYPAELNYSVSRESSHDMKRLLLKWIQYANEPVGHALGEFILALGTGKLKLCKADTIEVFESSSSLSGWLGQLALVVKERLGLTS